MSGGELIARLEAAEAGSRELDREVMALTYRWEQRHIGARCWDDANDTCCPGARHLDWVWVDPREDAWRTTAADGFEFTTSIDAALALAERVLPGLCWSVGQNVHHKHWTAYGLHILPDGEVETVGLDSAATPALALCIAILRATPTGEPEA